MELYGLDYVMERLADLEQILEVIHIPTRVMMTGDSMPYLECKFLEDIHTVMEYRNTEEARVEEMILDIRGLVPITDCNPVVIQFACDQFNATSKGTFAVPAEDMESVEFRGILPQIGNELGEDFPLIFYAINLFQEGLSDFIKDVEFIKNHLEESLKESEKQ